MGAGFQNTCIENYISSTVLKFLLLGTTGKRDSAVTAGSFYLKYRNRSSKLANQSNKKSQVNFFWCMVAYN